VAEVTEVSVVSVESGGGPATQNPPGIEADNKEPGMAVDGRRGNPRRMRWVCRAIDN
jgi:hypothetical protein